MLKFISRIAVLVLLWYSHLGVYSMGFISQILESNLRYAELFINNCLLSPQTHLTWWYCICFLGLRSIGILDHLINQHSHCFPLPGTNTLCQGADRNSTIFGKKTERYDICLYSLGKWVKRKLYSVSLFKCCWSFFFFLGYSIMFYECFSIVFVYVYKVILTESIYNEDGYTYNSTSIPDMFFFCVLVHGCILPIFPNKSIPLRGHMDTSLSIL